MEQSELLELIDKGEDSRTQYKKDINNAVQAGRFRCPLKRLENKKKCNILENK